MMTFFQKYLAQFDIEQLWMKCFSLILVYLFFLVAKRILHILVRRTLNTVIVSTGTDLGRKQTIIRLVENSLNYALYFFLIYAVLSILGLPVSSLLAGAGVAGVAIGLGAQGFLSDLVNGFFILIERQFDVGETVKLTNGSITISGVVKNVGIRTTQITDMDGTVHFIPNRNILVVSNQSRGDMRAKIDLPIPATADLEKVERIIQSVHQRELPHYPQIKETRILGPQTSPTGQFSYAVQFYVQNGQQTMIYHTFYGFYQEALKQEGIELVGFYPYTSQ